MPQGQGDPRERGATMSPLQFAYAVGRREDMPLGGIECVAYLEFRGARLDTERLQHAVGAVHRHAALRAVFEEDGRLVDGDSSAPVIGRYEVGDHPTRERERIRRSMMGSGVDISTGRNWALALSEGPVGTDQVLHMVFSAAAVDLAAIGTVLHDLAAEYHGTNGGVERVARISEVEDRLRRQRSLPTTTSSDRPDQMDPFLPGPDLPDLVEDVTTDPDVVTLHHELSRPQWERITQRAQEYEVSPTALLLAIYSRVLRRWSRRQEFTVLVPGLYTGGTEGLVADRTIAYAHRAHEGTDFAHDVRATAVDLRRRIAAGRDVMTEMREERTLGELPAPPRCVFTSAATSPVFSGLVREVLGTPRLWAQTPQVALDLRLVRMDEERVEVAADVRPGALPLRTARAIVDLFLEAVEDVIATGVPRADLPSGESKVRERANSTDPHPAALLHQGVHEHSRTRPDAMAVKESVTGRTITYADLDRRALEIAGAISARTRPGDLVAVQLPRGIDQIATLVGVLYAGRAYLPLNPDAPPARVARIRHQARWGLSITSEDPLPSSPPLDAPVPGRPEDLAYVIFTSGSTGDPKGVAISHASACNTLDDVRDRHALGVEDTVLGVSGIDFDLSVHDLFATFSAGARLVMVGDEATRDPFHWAEVVRREGVTVWNSVPMLLEMLLATGGDLKTLRLLLISGDRIPLDLPARSRDLAPRSTFVAMGGATEAAIWSNEYVIACETDLDPRWTSVPYGLPLTGQMYRVVDSQDRDLPDGVVGELLIGGAGVAQGYYKDPERTAQSFLTDTDGVRWYRTGDLGTWEQGLILFVGRKDTQVKIRGHRVECGETESRLDEQPTVAQSAVVPIRGNSALGAVLVPSTGQVLAVEQVKEQLAAQLPWYMVPSVLLPITTMPVTANGKVDRGRVTSFLEQNRDGQAPQGPEDSSVLAAVLMVWTRLLGTTVEDDSNFFSLGGDSLTATRMCADLRKEGVDAALADLFRAPVATVFADACIQRAASRKASPRSETAPETVRESWHDHARAEAVTLDSLGLREWCRWMWAHALSHGEAPVPEIGDDVDFFALGGDSLTAARLSADLGESGVHVALAEVFRHPRFADFVVHCTQQAEAPTVPDDSSSTSEEHTAPATDRFPLTGLQLAYALGHDGVPGVVRASPCVAVILQSEDPTVIAGWERALTEVVRRHDVLRLVRSEEWSQKVVPGAVPEITRVPLPLDDAQFRDLLRHVQVDPAAAPAVRGFIRTSRPQELGLVFSYLAMDSTSIGMILRDLADRAMGGPGKYVDPSAGEGVPGVDIETFRNYAIERTRHDAASTSAERTVPDVDLPPAPQIPILTVPPTPVDFTTTAQMLDRDQVQGLRTLARDHRISLNSVFLHAFGSALSEACGQPGITVNIPAAVRPQGAHLAEGQFSELALCTCGAGSSPREVHDALGAAVATAGSVPLGRTTDRQRYPVVFTSLLGTVLSEPFAAGAVRTVWTHTRTPAVLIDCQITPMPGEEIEVRWDTPAEVVDPAFVAEAFDEFTRRLCAAATQDEHRRQPVEVM
jgi:amino acid adenylation domain-containing protein